MGYYMEEEDVWKCRKHPRKHRNTTGICPLCLRDRLIRLCPNCANVRPCACYPTPPISSSSSSSSFSFTSSSDAAPNSTSSIGATGRISNLINNEPAFQRSRSAAAFPFLLRSKTTKGLPPTGLLRSKTTKGLPPTGNLNKQSSKPSSFWLSVFKAPKLKKVEEEEEERKIKMVRSKSVGVSSCASDSDKGVRLKRWSWYFPSPIKAFRLSRASSCSSKIVQQSPLCRG